MTALTEIVANALGDKGSAFKAAGNLRGRVELEALADIIDRATGHTIIPEATPDSISAAFVQLAPVYKGPR